MGKILYFAFLVAFIFGSLVGNDIQYRFLKSKPIRLGKDVRAGDFVFLSVPQKSLDMVKQFVYLGGDELLNCENKKIKTSDCLGAPVDQLSHSQKCKDGFFVFFGRLSRNASCDLKGSKVGCESKYDCSQIEELIKSGSFVEIKKVCPTIQVKLLYATPHNFAGKVVYDFEKAYLRALTVQKLARVQADLKVFGLGLKVTDAYRPISAHDALWSACPEPTLVASPERGSKHCYGTAVDVTLVDLNSGEELDMGCPIDEISERARFDYTKTLSQEQIVRRHFLRYMMERRGFEIYVGEWWHFNDKDYKRYEICDVFLADLAEESDV